MNDTMMSVIPWILMGVCIVAYMVYGKKRRSDIENNVQRKRECYIAEGLYLGMTLGLGFGYLAGQIHWGIGIGMVIGVVLGFIIPKKEKKSE